MNNNPSDTVVFVGPTLSIDAASQILKADYRPPVAFGDIYSLIGSYIDKILIIDGFFYGTTAVWQREIIEAMNNGIKVYGCSSMGALRAAELHLEGMTGFGQVFEWILDSTITGDDEVAVAHESTPPYRQLTIPLVNVRYGLKCAVANFAVTEEEAAFFLEIARSIHYYERTAEFLFHRATNSINNASALRLYNYWSGTIPDIKAADAVKALRNLADLDNTIFGLSQESTFHLERGKARRLHQWNAVPFIFRMINAYPQMFNLVPEGNGDTDLLLNSRLKKAEMVAAQIWLIEMGMDWLEEVMDPSAAWIERYRNSFFDSIAILPDDLPGICKSAGMSLIEMKNEVDRRAKIHFYLWSVRFNTPSLDNLFAPVSHAIDPLDWCIWPLMQGTDFFMSIAEIRCTTEWVILKVLSSFGICKEAVNEMCRCDDLFQQGPLLPEILGYQHWDKVSEISRLLLLSDVARL